MDDFDRYLQEQGYDAAARAELDAATAELDLGFQYAVIRQQRGLTQRELARRAGVPQAMIGRFERGHRPPSIRTLWKLADALGVVFQVGPGYTSNVVARGMDITITAAVSVADAPSAAYLDDAPEVLQSTASRPWSQDIAEIVETMWRGRPAPKLAWSGTSAPLAIQGYLPTYADAPPLRERVAAITEMDVNAA